jgi:hypothetical protein
VVLVVRASVDRPGLRIDRRTFLKVVGSGRSRSSFRTRCARRPSRPLPPRRSLPRRTRSGRLPVRSTTTWSGSSAS